MRAFWWLCLTCSVALVLAAAFPWGDLVGHTHWARVRWIPFFSRPAGPLDLIGNLLLCVPLGASVGRLGWKRPLLSAGVLAFALSFFVESAQLYSHYRFPSTSDLICNVAGAIVAAAAVDRLRR